MIGHTVSHYLVLEKLGEGGMGVVYKAEDTKLKRHVALKFLPPHLSASEQDKSRFIQEAQAASALNHPNVCTIHDIQEHDGQIFIVMEFVDGQTLREKRGSISFKQAIDIGLQIAEGLAAAHEKGIVHRDIKPENIMIRKDGIAQIMDFGLAKLRSRTSAVNRLTKEGSTVGTAGYMSPEQIQGQDVDHRSDIFSLGVLLYELFAGQLPFKGVHETALLYEIVNVDPVPLSALNAEIDPELDRIVLECLEKEVQERAQSAKQIAIDLKRFRRSSTRQHLSRTMASRPALAAASARPVPLPAEPALRRPPSRREIAAWSLAGLLLVALAYGAFRSAAPAPKAERTVRSSIMIPDSIYLHAYGAAAGPPVFSPDGRYIAFTGILPDGSSQIYLRSLDNLELHGIAGTEGGFNPFWSPDGKMIGFFQERKMKKIDLAGGSATTITVVPNQRGGTWNSDGTILYVPDYQSGMYQIASDGHGTPTPVTTLDSVRHEGSHRWPVFLPDGRHFLYLVRTAAETGEAEGDAVFVGSLDGKTKKLLVQSSYNAAYAGGYLLFARGPLLMAQRFNLETLSLEGDPAKLLDGMLNDPSYNIAVFTAASQGALLYQSGQTQAGARPLLLDRSGKILQTIGDNLLEQDHPRFSPDGKQIAMYMFDMRSRRSNIWIYDLRTNGRRRLTDRSEGDFYPIWSPDGGTIAFSSGGVTRAKIFTQPVSHSGRGELLFNPAVTARARDYTSDGSMLLVETNDPAVTVRDLVLVPVHGSVREPVPFQATRFDEHDARISPDGKWVAFVSDESGDNEVYVKNLSTPQADPWKISTGGGGNPVWGAGGKEIVFVNSRGQVVSATLALGESRVETAGTTVLFHLPTFTSEYDLSPGGTSFVVTRFLEMQKLSPLTLVTAWEKELAK